MKLCANRQHYALLLPLGLLAVVTLLSWVTPLDTAIASLFYDPSSASNAWPIGKLLPFDLAYRYGEKLCVILPLIACLSILVSSIWNKKVRHLRRAALFALALLALGPGILINGVLKPYTGRPRPRMVQQFGGEYQYRSPLELGPTGNGRYSFPSGHAAVAFYVIFPYFILRGKDRKRAFYWLGTGLALGTFMGLARMAQGAHWTSDIVWSLGIVYFCGYALAGAFKLRGCSS